MQWTWCLECDLQLFLLMPLFVMTYKKSQRAGVILALCTFLLGIGISYQVVTYYQITAGIFTLDNVNLYSMYMNKPYCKLANYSLGVMCAMFFLEIAEYKKKGRGREAEKGQRKRKGG